MAKAKTITSSADNFKADLSKLLQKYNATLSIQHTKKFGIQVTNIVATLNTNKENVSEDEIVGITINLGPSIT